MKNFTTIKVISLIFLCGAFLLLLNNCEGGENNNNENPETGGDSSSTEGTNGDTPDSSENTGTICDRLSIAKLKESCGKTPDWLKAAQTSGEVVSVNPTVGSVTWHEGTWHNGTWKGWTWENGIWENGTWKSGRWENGTWENGTWKSGNWKGGTWESGTWEGGFRNGRVTRQGFDPANP